VSAAAVACVACGTELPPRSKFCNECGTAIAATLKPAEYKQVTVLFADVVQSMDIATAVGAERLREIMAGLVDRATGVVQHFGGTVDKFTGDGIMAVFGAPVALEDHAVRACLAALAIQDEAKQLAVDVQDRDGVKLWLRIGLNSGQVIAGEIGSGVLGYTAIGEHVGMAQRMESVAPPGGVVLSESTARLVDGLAALGEPELVQIKGADDPVPARRLVGMGEQHRAGSGSPGGARTSTTPLPSRNRVANRSPSPCRCHGHTAWPSGTACSLLTMMQYTQPKVRFRPLRHPATITPSSWSRTY
jgi:adenylate cyclase